MSGDAPSRGGIDAAVGNTPMIYLKSISEQAGCDIYAKAEFMNPTGSIKDRTAKNLLEDAERRGKLLPSGSVVEGTGGNTGIALAQLGCAKGYKVILCMPENISIEKINHMKRFGAEVHVQPCVPFSDPTNYARYAETLAKERNAFHTNQFENAANYEAHLFTTGPEISAQCNGHIDGFICSSGTGGTLAGISMHLKKQDAKTQCYLVDCAGSILHSYVQCQGRSGGLDCLVTDAPASPPQRSDGLVSTQDAQWVANAGGTMIEGIGIGRITHNACQWYAPVSVIRTCLFL